MKRHTMKRGAPHAIVATFALLTGCSDLIPSVQQQGAQRHWDKVRAQLKHQLAQDQFGGGAFEEAVVSITEAILQDPSQPGYYALLARAELELDRPSRAQQALDAAAAMELRSAELAYMEGVILERNEMLPEALERYREARVTDAANVDYLVAEAECLVAMDEPLAALTLVEEYLVNHAHSETINMLAGHLATLTGDNNAAVKWYGRAKSAMPDNPLATERYGFALLKAQRYTEAGGVLRTLLTEQESGRQTDAIRRAVALCDLQTGREEEARSALIDYTRRHPSDIDALVLLAKAAVATGDLMTASRCVYEALRAEPGNPEVWFVASLVKWKRGDLPGAVQSLEDVLAANGKDVEARCLLAEILRASGEVEKAHACFEQALHIDPGCDWATRGLETIESASRGL
jgi:Tfp pilus assembly protein PilF